MERGLALELSSSLMEDALLQILTNTVTTWLRLQRDLSKEMR